MSANNNSGKVTHNKHLCTTPYCKGKKICGLNHAIDEIKEAIEDTGLPPVLTAIIRQYHPCGVNLNILDSDMIDDTPRLIPKVVVVKDVRVHCTSKNCNRKYCTKFHPDEYEPPNTPEAIEAAKTRLLNSMFVPTKIMDRPETVELRKIQDNLFKESVIAARMERERKAVEAKCELSIDAGKYIEAQDYDYVIRTNNRTELMYIPELGNIVDAKDSWGFWWRSIIISDINCSYSQPNAAKFIKHVHFLGFPSCCDEKINIAMQDRIHKSGSNTVGIRRIQQSFLKTTWDYAEMKQHGYMTIPDFITRDYNNTFSICDRQICFLYNSPISKPLIITTCLVCGGNMRNDVFNLGNHLGDNQTCGNCIGAILKEDKKMSLPVDKICDTCRNPASYTILDTDEYVKTSKEVYCNICAACIMEREKKSIAPFNDQPINFLDVSIKAQDRALRLFANSDFTTIDNKILDPFEKLIKCPRCNKLAFDINGVQMFKPGLCGTCQTLHNEEEEAKRKREDND